jgi:hypothetical protein
LARRISVNIWFMVTRPAWVARKKSSFICTAWAELVNAAPIAVSSIVEIDRAIITSIRLKPGRAVPFALVCRMFHSKLLNPHDRDLNPDTEP